MTHLKSCKCGSRWVVIHRSLSRKGIDRAHYAACTACNATGPTGNGLQDAARKWNQDRKEKR